MKKNAKRKPAQRKKRGSVGSPAQFASASFAGLAIAVMVALFRGFAFDLPGYLKAWYLSDGFFVAGVMLTGVGILVWVSTKGFFDMFSYAIHSIPVLFTAIKRPEEHTHYYDFKETREANRKKPLYFLMIVGAGFLLLSAICLGMYYNLPS